MKYDNKITLHQRHLTFISFQLCKVEILYVFFLPHGRCQMCSLQHLLLLVYFTWCLSCHFALFLALVKHKFLMVSLSSNSICTFNTYEKAALLFAESVIALLMVPRDRVDGWVNVTWSININVTGWVERKESRNMKEKRLKKSYRSSVWEMSDKLMLNELMKRFLICSAVG
jgi:hypothetical protein